MYFQILKDAPRIEGRAGLGMEPYDFVGETAKLKENFGDHITERDAVSHALYPKVFEEYTTFRDQYGPVDKLDTKTFLIGPEIAGETMVRWQLYNL